MRRHLADLEVERQELLRVFDDLAARDDNRGKLGNALDAGDLEELKRQPLDRTAAAVAAGRTMARAGDLAGLDRLRALVDRPENLAVTGKKNRLECRRPNVDAALECFRIHFQTFGILYHNLTLRA